MTDNKIMRNYYNRLRWVFSVISCLFITGCSTDAIDKAKLHLIQEMYEFSIKGTEFFGTKIFESLFKIFNTVYKNGFNVLTDSAFNLIVIGFSLWLAFYTLRLVGALNAPSPVDYLNTVFKRGFVVMCFAILLKNPETVRWLLNHTVVLVIGAFGATSIDILNSVMSSMGSTKDLYGGSCSASALSALGETTDPDHLNALRDAFSCVLLETHKQLQFGIAYGRVIKFLADGVFNKLAGGLMVILFTFVDFIIPLFIMDGLFKFMIAMILSPLFCAAWVFPASRGFVKKGWSIVMGMGLQILFTVTYVCIAVACVRSFTGDNPDLATFLTTGSFGDSANFDKIMESLQKGKVSSLALVFCGIFIMLMADKMSALANSFSGAPASSVISDSVKSAISLAAKAAARLVEAAVTIVAAVYTGGAAAAAKEAAKLAIKAAIKAAMLAMKKAATAMQKGK